MNLKLITRKNNVYLSIITKDDNKVLLSKFNQYKIPKKFFKIISLNGKELITELSDNDVAFFYLNENYSVKASFPTKIAEFLSLGIPIVCNNFNDDIIYYIKNYNIGMIYNFNNEDPNKLLEILTNIKKNIHINDNCRLLANEKLSLKFGISKYEEVYNNL